jgi:hypothetical protein
MDDNTTVVGATHQVRNGGQIALGAATATPVTPPPKDEIIDAAVAYPGIAGHPVQVFTLATDIDCYAGTGRSRLRTRGHTWTDRTWPHPFTGEVTNETPSQITAVGVGLAMVAGTGTPTVMVDDFSVYFWNGPQPWWGQMLTALG